MRCVLRGICLAVMSSPQSDVCRNQERERESKKWKGTGKWIRRASDLLPYTGDKEKGTMEKGKEGERASTACT